MSNPYTTLAENYIKEDWNKLFARLERETREAMEEYTQLQSDEAYELLKDTINYAPALYITHARYKAKTTGLTPLEANEAQLKVLYERKELREKIDALIEEVKEFIKDTPHYVKEKQRQEKIGWCFVIGAVLLIITILIITQTK